MLKIALAGIAHPVMYDRWAVEIVAVTSTSDQKRVFGSIESVGYDNYLGKW